MTGVFLPNVLRRANTKFPSARRCNAAEVIILHPILLCQDIRFQIPELSKESAEGDVELAVRKSVSN